MQIGQADWNYFLDAQRIRNRIAHPKMPKSFEITDSEIEICKNASSWFLTLLLALYEGLVLNIHPNKTLERNSLP